MPLASSAYGAVFFFKLYASCVRGPVRFPQRRYKVRAKLASSSKEQKRREDVETLKMPRNFGRVNVLPYKTELVGKS